MQERHTNRERYFIEQGIVTEKYIIPYIEAVCSISPEMVIGEIGCGEGGNLRPFLDRGHKVIGIDLSQSKIENGISYYAEHPLKHNLTLIAEDIYDSDPTLIPKFDIIIMRDTIVHIPNQAVFLKRVRDFAQVKGHDTINLEIAQKALDLLEVDALGLDKNDRRILEVLINKFGGGPVGLNTLSAATGEEEDTITDIHEPFLIRLGLLAKTPKGRVATEMAYQHLNINTPASKQQKIL